MNLGRNDEWPSTRAKLGGKSVSVAPNREEFWRPALSLLGLWIDLTLSHILKCHFFSMGWQIHWCQPWPRFGLSGSENQEFSSGSALNWLDKLVYFTAFACNKGDWT
jgi:hypothetical protein